MTSIPSKFAASPEKDTEPGVVWQTAEWTEERSGGGPGPVFESFTDAVTSFDKGGVEFHGWHFFHGEWNPGWAVHTSDGYIEQAEEDTSGVPRVIRSVVTPARIREL